MRLTTGDGTQIFFETYGEKENAPVVLIHGLGADHEMWTPQISTFPKHDLFTIVPDMRCHGQSSCGSAFHIEDCARDIVELLDHLNLTTAHLVGVSMGGLIVQQFACDYPDRVDRLIICDSFSEVRTWFEKTMGWMQWMTIKIAPGLLARSVKAAYRGEDRAEARTYFEKAFARTDKDRLLMTRTEVNRFNIIDRLPEVTAPTLVLVGDQFGKFPIKMAEKTADAIQGSRFQILDGGCDPSNMIVPELFDHAILDFIP